MLSVGRAAAQDSWATKAPDLGVKSYPVSGEINGLIYVYGYDQDAFGNQSSFVPRLSIYNPALNTWTNGASPSLIRAGASGGIINGKMYVVGGCIMADCNSVTNVLEIYDPVTNTWSYGAPAPTARIAGAAGVIAGKLYVTGGQEPSYSTTNTTEIYDPAGPLGSWTTGVPIPTSFVNPMGAVVNGLFYVIGGFLGSEVGTVQVYDPSPLVNSWSTRSPMPTFRGGAAVGVINGHIYVVGGNTNSGILAVNESYDPVSDYWTERTPLPTARASATGSVVNSKLYVIGGTTYVQPLGANEEYSPNLAAPVGLTLTLAPGSVIFPSVQVAVTSNDEPEEIYTLFFNQLIDAGAGSHRLLFAAPAGYTVTPAQVDLQLQASDSVTVALFFAAIDTTPPVLTVSSNLIAEATGAGGATVTFLPPTATDDSGVQSVSCDRSSGENFGIGVTTVQCSATDTAGNVTNQGFTVTVQDTTPPALTLPNNLVTDATSPAGSSVAFTVSATDLVDGSRPVVCAPTPGAVFAIGLTTVSCMTADTRGNDSTGGFTVTVRSAVQIVTDLAVQAASADFQAGSNLLQNVLTSIGSGNTGAACQQLSAFINQAQTQAGKKLTIAQAAALVAAANSGKAALGCS